MRSYKTDAIIVKRRNFGESDRILTVLTKTYGKIQVRAPGVRKITSRRSSHIELLNLALLTLYRNSHSSLPIIIEAQAQEEFLPIKKTLKKIGFAYYICELIDNLCAQNQENKIIFFLARETFFKLSNYSSSEGVPNGTPESRNLKDDISRQDGYRTGQYHSVRPSPEPTGSGTVTRQARTITLNSIISDFEDNLLVTLGFLPRQHKLVDKMTFIESILEKKLRVKRFLPLFLGNSES